MCVWARKKVWVDGWGFSPSVCTPPSLFQTSTPWGSNICCSATHPEEDQEKTRRKTREGMVENPPKRGISPTHPNFSNLKILFWQISHTHPQFLKIYCRGELVDPTNFSRNTLKLPQGLQRKILHFNTLGTSFGISDSCFFGNFTSF